MIRLPDYYKHLPRDSSRAYPSIRIFRSDKLEAMTHVHPIVPAIIWIPVVFYFLKLSVDALPIGGFGIFSVFCVGLLVWTLSEYTLHRFVFHFNPKTRWGERVNFLVHGIHHADPVDPSRLVMPPAPAFLLAVGFYFLLRTIFGQDLVYPVFAGFLSGYLCYDYTHYSLHHFAPKTRFGKWMKHQHMIHHFVAPESRWGVSSPVWDFIFGTLEEKKSVVDVRSI